MISSPMCLDGALGMWSPAAYSIQILCTSWCAHCLTAIEPWRRLEANALIRVKGVYMAARTGCGLMLEVEQMQIRPDESQTLPPKSVF